MRPVCDKIQISYAEYGQEAEELTEKLEEMNNKTILAQRGRIGIVNIYKRLQLFYNDGYELNFQNLAPHGLSCFLKVPMETKDL